MLGPLFDGPILSPVSDSCKLGAQGYVCVSTQAVETPIYPVDGVVLSLAFSDRIDRTESTILSTHRDALSDKIYSPGAPTTNLNFSNLLIRSYNSVHHENPLEFRKESLVYPETVG